MQLLRHFFMLMFFSVVSGCGPDDGAVQEARTMLKVDRDSLDYVCEHYVKLSEKAGSSTFMHPLKGDKRGNLLVHVHSDRIVFELGSPLHGSRCGLSFIPSNGVGKSEKIFFGEFVFVPKKSLPLESNWSYIEYD